MPKRTAAFILTLVIAVLLGMVMSTSRAQDFGSNWTGQYYNTADFSGTVVLIRVDAQINFNYGTGSPATGINPDNFSIRWTGVQNFTASGTYTFTAFFDDTIRVLFDGVEIMNYQAPPSAAVSATANVTAGSHTIVVEYSERSANAFVQFQWSLAGAATASVTAGPSPTPGPTFTPSVTALPGIPSGAITATVIRASVLNVRDAPSTGGNVVGRILRGQTYAIVGRDVHARWFLLQLSGKQAWAFGYYLYISGNEFNPPVVSGASAFGNAGVPDYGVVAQSYSTLKLRASPSVASPQTGRVTWGAFVPVIGRTPDGYWWQVVWKGTIGWVYSPFLKIFQGDINKVPIKTG